METGTIKLNAVIVALIGMVISAAVWFGKLGEKVSSLEKNDQSQQMKISKLEERIYSSEKAAHSLSGEINTLGKTVHSLSETMDRLERDAAGFAETADSLIKDVESQKLPAQPETEIKLQDAVHMIKKMTIDVPKEGTVITQGVYNEMHGTYEGKIATGYKLWVLAKHSYNFYLMYPPMEVVPSMQRWSQTNIRLATPGRWELHVCLANEAASKWLKVRATAGNWGGFSSLPEGMETVRSVKVKRQ